MTSVFARMNSGGNKAHMVGLSAVSQISGSSNFDTCSQATSQERVRRNNRRARKANSPADQNKSFRTSHEHFGRSDFSRRSAASLASSGNSNSSSNFLAQSPSKLAAYAGAKFGDAPSPRLLPLPPQHWLSNGNLQTLSVRGPCQNLTSEIKTILQVA